jgi:hypothetical protein
MKHYGHHQVSELNMFEHFLGPSKAFEILANLGLDPLFMIGRICSVLVVVFSIMFELIGLPVILKYCPHLMMFDVLECHEQFSVISSSIVHPPISIPSQQLSPSPSLMTPLFLLPNNA